MTIRTITRPRATSRDRTRSRFIGGGSIEHQYRRSIAIFSLAAELEWRRPRAYSVIAHASRASRVVFGTPPAAIRFVEIAGRHGVRLSHRRVATQRKCDRRGD